MECDGKARFANERMAEFYIKKLKVTSKRIKKPVRAYLCTKCLLWHLTSQSDAEKENDKLLIESLRKKVQNQKILIQQLNEKLRK